MFSQGDRVLLRVSAVVVIIIFILACFHVIDNRKTASNFASIAEKFPKWELTGIQVEKNTKGNSRLARTFEILVAMANEDRKRQGKPVFVIPETDEEMNKLIAKLKAEGDKSRAKILKNANALQQEAIKERRSNAATK